MIKIDFTKYPNVLPYINEYTLKHVPFEYSVLTEELFIEIVEKWIDIFEKNIDVISKNTFLIYQMFQGQSGHRMLAHDIERWKNSKLKSNLSVDDIKKMYLDNFSNSIGHVYQNHWYKDMINKIPEYRGGSGGLCSVSWYVQFHDSDKKGVKYTVATNFMISVNVEFGNWI
jgi:hypothetical protein